MATVIIDSHVHVFPDEIRRDRSRFCRMDPSFERIYGDPRARMATAEEVLEALDEAGVDGAVVFGFPWRDPSICRDHNDYIQQACSDQTARLVGLACVSPVLGERGIREVERCLEKGMKGCGELATYGEEAGGLDTPFFTDLAFLLGRWGLPLLLHATESVGHDYAGKDRTDLGSLWRWIRSNPDIDLVLAHWGGGLFFFELMPEVHEACARVYYDTSASPFLYRPQIYRTALEIVGGDRILFGSDFPLIHPKRYLGEIRAQGIPSGKTAGLIGENAARLWGWADSSRSGGAP